MAAAVGVWLLFTTNAAAQPAPDSSQCPPGNLLAGLAPHSFVDVRGKTGLVTDGTAANEGTIWDAPLAVILEGAAAHVTYDLGRVLPVTAMFIQADANDTYSVSGSVDGVTFRALGHIDPVTGHGLRSRPLAVGGQLVRFLRFGHGEGDGSYSLSELQAFCELPTPFPPKLPTKAAPMAPVDTGILTYWNDKTSARWELVLAALGLALLAWEHQLRRKGHPGAWRTLRRRALASLGVIAAFTYINFGFFHFPNFIHNWDTFHYYIGSKYSPELGYSRLYECVAVSDAEDPKLRPRVQGRKLTNLRTNVLESTKEILAHPELCKDRFSPQRWESFKQDTAFFRAREGLVRWDDAQTDHGYNGTPVWNIAGTILANLAPASLGQIVALTLLDQMYLAAMIGIVWWAFGFRVLAVALMVFATNFPSRFYWTGGSFLRWDWLFYTVASVCCLKKERPALGGAFLAYATLLRVFPGFMFLGPLAALGFHFVKERKLEPRLVRFFAGAALATTLLVPVSLATSGGIGGYREFISNTRKHKETPLTNAMGLKTLVHYRPWEVGRVLRDNKLTDPWSVWKTARTRAFEQAKPAYFVLVAGFLVILVLTCRNAEPWVAAALATTFIGVGVELTCYYYAFVMATALLYEKDESVGRVLLLMTGFTQFVAWAPLPFMATWIDEQYTLMSLGTLVAFGLILWQFRPGGAAHAPPEETPQADVPDRPTGRALAQGHGRSRRHARPA